MSFDVKIHDFTVAVAVVTVWTAQLAHPSHRAFVSVLLVLQHLL